MSSPSLSDPEYYLNRELSELAFQSRVLAEGLDDRNPLLERVRFLAYFTKNTDEFFMKRVGGLKQQMEAGVTETTPDGRTPEQQWEEVLDAAQPLFERQTECWETDLKPALADAGVTVFEYDDLSPSQRRHLRTYFEESVLPTLTPLAFDPAHPFPFISNLSLSLAVLSESDADDEVTFTRIKVPQNQPRFVEVPGEMTGYVLIEDLIEQNIDLLLPDLDIVDVSKFKVTRNAEVRRSEEVAEDLIDMIEEVIEQRRFATVVRLEVDADMPERSVSVLKRHLDVEDREVFYREGPIDFRDFFELAGLDRPELKLPEWSPQPHPRLERAPDAATDWSTPPQAALIYRLSGDPNPLHASPAVARAAGFERPILHGLCTLGVWGPDARNLLSEVAEEDVSHEAFPPYTAKEITIGEVDVWALRISYVGERGWELYAPTEQGQRLWDVLWEAGQEYDVRPVGMGVYGTTGRMEKGYRLYGHELEIEYDPAEAGLTFHGVKDADFIGKEAYAEALDSENAATLCTLSVDDHAPDGGEPRFMLGSEPVLDPDGEVIVDEEGRRSYVTSAGTGPSVGKHLLMAYLPPEYAEEGQGLQVEYMGQQYPVTVEVAGSRPLFDPENERIRS